MTRNSFKRKVIIFGVMIFASIALISTGFAAWIISQNAKQESTGNIKVGVVTDNNIKIDTITFEPSDVKNFVFEPSKERKDITSMDVGKTYVFREDGTPGQNLKVTFTAVVHNYKAISSLVVKLVLPEGVKNAGKTDNPKNNYLVLPVCSGEDGAKLYDSVTGKVDATVGSTDEYTITEDSEANTATIKYTIEFKWGQAFNGQNPSDYYNSMPVYEQTAEGRNIAEEMKAFRNVITGNADETTEFTREFTIIIEAIAK